MIGITISAKAYSVIAAKLPGNAAVERDIAAHGDCRIWAPRRLVECLIAQREPGETFSEVILRMGEAGLLLSHHPVDVILSDDKK